MTTISENKPLPVLVTLIFGEIRSAEARSMSDDNLLTKDDGGQQ
jgi:hypothetical protein